MMFSAVFISKWRWSIAVVAALTIIIGHNHGLAKDISLQPLSSSKTSVYAVGGDSNRSISKTFNRQNRPEYSGLQLADATGASTSPPNPFAPDYIPPDASLDNQRPSPPIDTSINQSPAVTGPEKNPAVAQPPKNETVTSKPASGTAEVVRKQNAASQTPPKTTSELSTFPPLRSEPITVTTIAPLTNVPDAGSQTAKVPVAPKLESQQSDYLQDIILAIGRDLSLGQAVPANSAVKGDDRNCVAKQRNAIVFCIQGVDWPNSMKPLMRARSVLYVGQKAIVRYDRNLATRIHVVFPTSSFKAVAGYYETQLGLPTETWQRSVVPLGKPRLANPTHVWRSVNSETQVVTSLEVRKFDDTRGGFPDTKRGAIILYQSGSEPIFPQVSEIELMSLKERGIR